MRVMLWAMKPMPFFSRYGRIAKVVSGRLRQPTPIQGLEGTNWKLSLSLMTVT